MHLDTILLKICKCKISTQKFFLFFLQLTEVSRQGKNKYIKRLFGHVLSFDPYFYSIFNNLLLPSRLWQRDAFTFNFEKNPNKTIEIHVVDERDLKYILTPMACFVTNYNNSCMFNLYSLSAIKNHDTPLMVFEKKNNKAAYY